jgi:Flp pilus assembly protein TadD
MEQSLRRTTFILGGAAALFAITLYLATICIGVDPGAQIDIASGAAGYGSSFPLRDFLWIALLRLFHWIHPALLVLGPRIAAIAITAVTAALLVRSLCWMRTLPPPSGYGLAPPPLLELPNAASLGALTAALVFLASPILWQSTITAIPDLPALLLAAFITERLAAGPAQQRLAPIVTAHLLFGFLVILHPVALLLFPFVAWSANHGLRRSGRFDFPAIASCLVFLLIGALAGCIALAVHIATADHLLAPSEQLRIEQIGTGGRLAVYLFSQIRPLKPLFTSPAALALLALVALPAILIALGRRMAMHYGLSFLSSWNRFLFILGLPVTIVALSSTDLWLLNGPRRPSLFAFWLTALWSGWLLQELLLELNPESMAGEKTRFRGARLAVSVILVLALLLPAIWRLPDMDRQPLAATRPMVEFTRKSLTPERQPIGQFSKLSEFVRFVGGTWSPAPSLIDLGRPRYLGQDKLLWELLDRFYRGSANAQEIERVHQLDFLGSPQTIVAYHRPVPYSISGVFYRPVQALDELDAEQLHTENTKLWAPLLTRWLEDDSVALQHPDILPLKSYCAKVLNDLGCLLYSLERPDLAQTWIERAHALDPDNPVASLNSHELCTPVPENQLARAVEKLERLGYQPTPDEFGYLVSPGTIAMAGNDWAEVVFNIAAPAFSALPSSAETGSQAVSPSTLLEFMGNQGEDEDATGEEIGPAPFTGTFQEAITRAQNLVASGDEEAASEFLDQVRKKFADEPRLPVIEAGMAVVRKEWDRAEQLYREILEDRPNDRSARIGLGITLAQSERLQESFDILRPILENPVSDEESLALLPIGINLAEQLQEWDLYESWVQQMRDLSPGLPSVPWLERLVVLYWNQQRMPWMEAACSELLALAPNSGIGNIYVALATQQQIEKARGETENEAETAEQRRISSRIWPEKPEAQARLLEFVGGMYQKGLDKKPLAFAHNNLALLYLELSRLEKEHSGITSQAADDWFEQAMNQVRFALQIEPEYISALDTSGYLLILRAAASEGVARRATLIEADRTLEKAADLAGANPPADLLLHRAQYHWLSGQTAIGDGYARQALNKGLRQQDIDRAYKEIKGSDASWVQNP